MRECKLDAEQMSSNEGTKLKVIGDKVRSWAIKLRDCFSSKVSTRAPTPAGYQPISQLSLPPSLTGPVHYKSPELVCLHEAGHAVAARLAGAAVVEMELYLAPTPVHGRTRIKRNENQRAKIALGGFAIERRLWEEGRLLWPNGRRPTEKEMLSESADNADIDRVSYFGKDYRMPDGHWPPDMDIEFMSKARDLGRVIDIALVERLAGVLLVEKQLDESRIGSIFGD